LREANREERVENLVEKPKNDKDLTSERRNQYSIL